MATVTGLTAQRMLEIEASCIVSGAVDLNGDLRFTRRDGQILSAGNIMGPKGDPGLRGPGLIAGGLAGDRLFGDRRVSGRLHRDVSL